VRSYDVILQVRGGKQSAYLFGEARFLLFTVCRTKSGRQNASQEEKNFTLGLVVCLSGSIARGTPICFQSQSKNFGDFVPIIKDTRLLALALQGVGCGSPTIEPGKI
jgi:hypothetical protein